MWWQSIVERKTATDPGGGGGVAARISSTIRPQDPGGGAARIAAPRGVVDIEVTNSPELSVVEPQSVPSRISVVLVEEAKVGALHVWGAHMWIRIYVCWLEWRSRPVWLFVKTVMYRHVWGGDSVLFRPRREAHTIPSRSCWPCWPVWDAVPV